jgi:sialic acid synthase SpsE
MLTTKRPGSGMPARLLEDVVGRRAVRDLNENVLIGADDFA